MPCQNEVSKDISFVSTAGSASQLSTHTKASAKARGANRFVLGFAVITSFLGPFF
jgi:hypothetical protein